MPSILLVEFLVRDRFFFGWTYPFIKGFLKDRGAPIVWLRFGIEPDVQFQRNEQGAGLDPTDTESLQKIATKQSTTHIIFSSAPAPSLLTSILAVNPGVLLGLIDDSGTPTSFGPALDQQLSRVGSSYGGILDWIGLENESANSKTTAASSISTYGSPDYEFEAANSLARSIPPIVALDAGLKCGYTRPITSSSFLAERVDLDLPSHYGCTFCTAPAEERDESGTKSERFEALSRQLLAAARTLPPGDVPVCYRINGSAPATDPVRFAKLVIDAKVRPGRFLLGYRADRIVRLADKIREAAVLLATGGHRFDICLVGIESFSSKQLDRFNKGYGPEVNLQCIRILRELEADLPEAFAFREYGGLSTVLFDPWTDLAEISLNLEIAELFRLADICGKLLTSRLRLVRQLPLAAVAEHDGLLTQEYDDPLFQTAQRNFYSDELPWRFASPGVEELVRVLIRLPADAYIEDGPLCQQISQWQRRSGLTPLECALSVVGEAKKSAQPLTAEELITRAAAVVESHEPLQLVDGNHPRYKKLLLEASHGDTSSLGLRPLTKRVRKLDFFADEASARAMASLLAAEDPTSAIVVRQSVASTRGDWEIIVGPEPDDVELAHTIVRELETNPTQAPKSVRQMGVLLGYPACCAWTYAKDPLVFHTHNEWLWVQRRLEAADRLEHPFPPFVTEYVPCSLECPVSTSAMKKEGDVIPLWRTQHELPTIIFLDVGGGYISLLPQEKPSTRFRYEVAFWSTTAARLEIVRRGDTLVVEPGILRFFKDDQEVGFFTLEAFLWWSERVFHREFWMECCQRLASSIATPVSGLDQPELAHSWTSEVSGSHLPLAEALELTFPAGTYLNDRGDTWRPSEDSDFILCSGEATWLVDLGLPDEHFELFWPCGDIALVLVATSSEELPAPPSALVAAFLDVVAPLDLVSPPDDHWYGPLRDKLSTSIQLARPDSGKTVPHLVSCRPLGSSQHGTMGLEVRLQTDAYSERGWVQFALESTSNREFGESYQYALAGWSVADSDDRFPETLDEVLATEETYTRTLVQRVRTKLNANVESTSQILVGGLSNVLLFRESNSESVYEVQIQVNTNREGPGFLCGLLRIVPDPELLQTDIGRKILEMTSQALMRLQNRGVWPESRPTSSSRFLLKVWRKFGGSLLPHGQPLISSKGSTVGLSRVTVAYELEAGRKIDVMLEPFTSEKHCFAHDKAISLLYRTSEKRTTTQGMTIVERWAKLLRT